MFLQHIAAEEPAIEQPSAPGRQRYEKLPRPDVGDVGLVRRQPQPRRLADLQGAKGPA